MAITPVPTMTDTPPFPALADRAEGTYNSKAFEFAAHMADTFNDELVAVATNVLSNATEAVASATLAAEQAVDAATSASAAAGSVGEAGVLAGIAGAKAGDAEAARAAAAVFAAAAEAAAGMAEGITAFVDTSPIVKGSADETKRVRIEVDGLTTGTTRVLSAPDKDGTIATLDDLPASSFETGDVLTTARSMAAPDWLPCGRDAYLQSSYPTLAGVVGIGLEFDELADPATLPTGDNFGANFSPDGVYLAIATAVSPYVLIYKRVGDMFTKLANPASLPAGAPQLSHSATAWSPDGVYLAIAHATTPFVTIYKRTGDTFTKLANPAALPASSGRAVAFSPDGFHLAMDNNVYSRVNDTFTKITTPYPTAPSSVVYALKYSSDGTHLVCSLISAPFIEIFKRNNNQYDKIEGGVVGNTMPGNVAYAVDFTPDDAHLVYTCASDNKVRLATRVGDVFTEVFASATGTGAYGARFFLNGQYAVTTSNAFLKLWQRVGNTLEEVTMEGGGLPAVVSARAAAVTAADGTFIAVCEATSPYAPVLLRLAYDPATQFVVPLYTPADSRLTSYIKT